MSSLLSRKGTYERRDESAENLERLTKKFSSDLRDQVQKLNLCEIFSSEWLSMLEIIQNLSKIAKMEHKTPGSLPSTIKTNQTFNSVKRKSNIVTSNNVFAYKKRTSDLNKVCLSKTSNETLWERDELVVRYILEDNKINMLLKMITTYKSKQYQLQDGILSISQICESLKVEEKVLRNKMKEFEEQLGQLLVFCFSSVEILQMLEINNLIEYASLLLDRSIGHLFVEPEDKESFSNCQETLVIVYLRFICDEIGSLQEERISTMLAEMNIIGKILSFLSRYHNKINNVGLFEISRSLSAILDLEFFQTNRNSVLNTEEEKKLLISMYATVFKNLLTSYENKKALRALVDTINRFKCAMEM
jgi:hypothetical protein